MSDRFLSRHDAAKLLSIAPATLAAWQYRARLTGRPDDAPPSTKIGKLRRYSERALLAWVAARASQAARQTTPRRRKGAAR
jgi:hypothetical protein